MKGMEIGQGLHRFLEQKKEKLKTMESENEKLKADNEELHEIALNMTTTNKQIMLKLKQCEDKVQRLQRDVSKYKKIVNAMKMCLLFICFIYLYNCFGKSSTNKKGSYLYLD